MTLGQILTLNFRGRNIPTYFEASRGEEDDGVRIFALAYFVQKLLAKTHMVIFGHLFDL